MPCGHPTRMVPAFDSLEGKVVQAKYGSLLFGGFTRKPSNSLKRSTINQAEKARYILNESVTQSLTKSRASVDLYLIPIALGRTANKLSNKTVLSGSLSS